MRHRKRKSGFTLVELLVVVGIISLLIGLLLPAITKAKAASRATTCASNLRQIGVLYIAYAQQNNEYVPLGHAESVPPNQLPYPDIDREPGNPTGGTDGVANFTNRNHYIWAYGRPSSAGGLFLTSGMVGKRSARIFYCPADLHGKPFKYDVPENPWPEQDGQLLEGIRPTVTRITYATRPVIGQAWGHDTLHHTCSFPELSQLFRLKNQAIMAELPAEHFSVFYFDLGQLIELVMPIIQAQLESDAASSGIGTPEPVVLPDLSAIEALASVAYERDGMIGTSVLLMISGE